MSLRETCNKINELKEDANTRLQNVNNDLNEIQTCLDEETKALNNIKNIIGGIKVK